MRLYGIQSPDPVALTSFSGIIRPLSVMFYAAKGEMAIKVMVLYVEMLGKGDLWNFRFVQSERWPFMRSLRARPPKGMSIKMVCHGFRSAVK